jgi:GGDEF domain-containing protein
MADDQPPGLETDWFDDAPYPMLATDHSGRILRANRALQDTVGLPAEQLLGHSRDSLPSPPHRALLAGDELVRLEVPGAPARTLRCRVLDGTAWCLHCYEDLSELQRLESENRQLQAQLAELQLSDPLTGLANDRAIGQALDQQVSRSRRYDNPLSVLLVRLADAAPADATVQALARLLRERMRWVDQLGRWRRDAFVAVLPETGLADARRLAEEIRAGVQDQLPGGPALRFGLAGWRRGDDARTLLQRATVDIGTAAQAGNG